MTPRAHYLAFITELAKTLTRLGPLVAVLPPGELAEQLAGDLRIADTYSVTDTVNQVLSSVDAFTELSAILEAAATINGDLVTRTDVTQFGNLQDRMLVLIERLQLETTERFTRDYLLIERTR